MAYTGLESEFLKSLKTDPEVADAIRNPTQFSELFGSILGQFGSASLRNVDALSGNALEAIAQGDKSKVYKDIQSYIDSDKSVKDKLLGVVKAPFQDNKSGVVSSLFGGDAVKDLDNKLKQKVEGLEKKQEIASSYGLGEAGLARPAAEVVGALPIARFGSMKNTTAAIKANGDALDIAKGLTKDTAMNVLTMGGSELALAKLYGKSDEEAIGNALAASVIGGLGTPLVGAGKYLAKEQKLTPREEAQVKFESGQQLTEEEMGVMAGGGTPPTIKTKSGREFESEDVAKSKKAVEDVEFDVVTPVKERTPLKENTYVPTVNNPLKLKYGYDDRGRVYSEESNLLSVQGTAEQKASLKIREKEQITSAKEEVDRRLNFYKNDSELRKAYRQGQARYKGKEEVPGDIEAINKQRFVIDQYADIMKNKNLDKSVRNEARSRFNELRKQKISRVKPSEDIVAKAKDLYSRQTDIKLPTKSTRDSELREEYETFVKNRGDKEGFVIAPTIDNKLMQSNVIRKARDSRDDVKSSIKAIKDKEKLLGNKTFSEQGITPELRSKYPNEVKVIEEYQDRVEDIKLYQKGSLTPDEFRFREEKRIMSSAKNDLAGISDKTKFNEYLEDLFTKLDNIGVYVNKDKLKVQFKPEASGFVEEPTKKMLREAKELEKAKYKHDFLAHPKTGAIATYRKTGKRTRSKDGRYTLIDSQIKDIKEGYLTDAEIANKTSPISINSARADAIKKAREYASEKVNKAIAKDLGIKSRFKEPEYINFKDTVLDASNSVAQISTVLLGSKRLAKLAKLYNTKVDIRDIVAEEMLNRGFKNASRATTKPLFMTKNYGQMRKGLVENVMKDQKIDKPEAEAFVDAFYEASKKVAPEMEELSDAIFKAFQDGKRTEFKWKLPDGFEVGFTLTKTKEGSISIRGNDYKVKIDTQDFNEFARALMPNIIHSVDAYVARRMNKLGIPTVHDAFIVPKGKEDFAKEAYGKIMVELNESNLLDDIMSSLGYKGKSLKVGDLESDMIMKSEHKLNVEHSAKNPELANARSMDVSRQSTPIGVMKDYMASGNYRQINTNQLIDSMVNEAGYNNSFLKLAREGDDPFERQVALAMQSPYYKKSLSVKVPDGVNASVWDKAQREIFQEARAKLEYHPFLRDTIQGERKHFTKNGKAIGDYTKTVQEIIDSEMRIARKLLKSKDRGEQRKLGSVNKIIREEASIKPNSEYTFNQAKAREFMDEVRAEVAQEKPKTNQYKTLWNEQVKSSKVYDEFNMLETIKNRYTAEVERSTETLYKEVAKIPKEKQDLISRLVDSDYESIRGISKETADKIWNENKQIRDIAWREINQIAKAMRDQSEQYGAYLNNAHLVRVRYGLDENAEHIIDQLISIKAMRDNDGWTALDKLKGDADAKFVLDVIAKNRQISKNVLFQDSPDKYVKGYKSEVYLGNKKIDRDGNVRWDADSRYEEGVLGADRENNRVGKALSKDELKVFGDMKFSSIQDELDFMTKNRLKKTNGEYRKVSGDAIRVEAGKTNDLAEVIAETHRSTLTKTKERDVIHKVLADLIADKSDLYSSVPKDGMFKLSNEQLKRLPYDLREGMQYVNIELGDKLLGRNEVRLYNGDKEVYKMADRLLANLGTAFKQNVVLKNPVSYINSILVNQTIGLSAGVSPLKLYKYQAKAIRDLKEMNHALDILTKQKLSGQKLDKALVNKLENNMLYKMEKAGLSTNRVEGVVGGDDLLGSILEKHVPSPIFKLARLINLNQKTAGGKLTLRMFSNIDTMGRYTIVQDLVDKGMHINDAVKEANGLYGNMDKMVPPLVEMIDKYGFVPFLKWFTLTSPKLLQLTKNNPKKALAVGVTTYMLGSETNTNFSSVNPIEAMVDFTEGSLPFGTFEKINKNGLFDTLGNRASSNVIPKYIKQDPLTTLYKLRKERINKPKYESSADYRGLTQQLIEGF